ncbi:hypothetical protein [Bacillus sp. 71mf]|uniref:hypothetical protein n=1 Tax=Bacillus sp. 71mf TaxID=1761757 RepID=UPI001113884B|nr:hypothetical protein [Bacillus sp. 71mf]
MYKKLLTPTNIGEGKLHPDMDGQNMCVFAKSYFRLCLTERSPHLTAGLLPVTCLKMGTSFGNTLKVPVIAIDRIVAGNDLIAFGTVRRGRYCQIL